MNLTAKLLANDPSNKFHAMQIIFIRMLSTSILCSLYCWYHNIPDFPFGKRGVRWLLVLRGSAGFIGLFGIYCKHVSVILQLFCCYCCCFDILLLQLRWEGHIMRSSSTKTRANANAFSRLPILA